MSKEKKAAFAEKQRSTSARAGASALTPISENTAMPKTVKKTQTRKQSRGK